MAPLGGEVIGHQQGRIGTAGLIAMNAVTLVNDRRHIVCIQITGLPGVGKFQVLLPDGCQLRVVALGGDRQQ